MRTNATPKRPKPALLAALVVLIALAFSTAVAAQAEVPDYVLRVTIDGGEAVVVLEDHSASIAGLSGSVTFDATVLGDAECEMLGGLGACNDVGGELKFALLGTAPLPVPVEVVRITFANTGFDDSQELRLTSVEAVTLQGVRLEGELIGASLTGLGSPLPHVGFIVAGLVAVALVVAFVFRRSPDKPLPEPA